MPANNRESLTKWAARGMRWSGVSRLMQVLSRRFEIVRSSSGGGALLRKNVTPKFAIICYHRVGTGGLPYYSSFDPAKFEAQLRFLKSAYRIVSLDELCHELDDPGRPTQAIALTFDDGYKDLYAHAFPILRRLSIPATIYLTAGAIETGEVSWYDRIFAQIMRYPGRTLHLGSEPHREFALPSSASRIRAAAEIVKVLRGYSNQQRIEACSDLDKCVTLPADETKGCMLNWAEIREMQEHGIAFGAHTMTHPVVRSLSPAEREHELAESKRVLEDRLQRPVVHFAYPFGSVTDIDAVTCSTLPGYGYTSAAATCWGLNTPSTHRYLLRRIGGEETSLSLFAARLRWLFLREQADPPSVQNLEEAVLQMASQIDDARRKDAGRKEDDYGAEVKRA